MTHNRTYYDQTPEYVVFTLSCFITVNPGEQHLSLCDNEESYQDISIMSNFKYISYQGLAYYPEFLFPSASLFLSLSLTHSYTLTHLVRKIAVGKAI